MLRRPPRATFALIAIAVGVAALGACGGGGGTDAGTGSTTTSRIGSVRLTAGPVTVERAGATGSADGPTVDALLAAAASVIRASSVDPLAGRPVRLDGLSTTAAAPLTRGVEAATLTDAGYGPLTDLEFAAQPAAVTLLTDASGAAVLGAVAIDVTATGRDDRGPVRVHRVGELEFVRDGATWLLDSWRLTVTRDGRGVGPAGRPTSTTVAP